MRRVASVFLPQLPIERLRRGTAHKLPDPGRLPELPVDDDPGACSVPRGGHWRPGARWAHEPGTQHRQPPHREFGRRSDAATHPFRTMRTDDGSRTMPHHSASDGQGSAPFILSIRQGQREIIHSANADALGLGLTRGMPITQARALYAELEVELADPAADNAALQRLAVHAVRHWTPTAAVSANVGAEAEISCNAPSAIPPSASWRSISATPNSRTPQARAGAASAAIWLRSLSIGSGAVEHSIVTHRIVCSPYVPPRLRVRQGVIAWASET